MHRRSLITTADALHKVFLLKPITQCILQAPIFLHGIQDSTNRNSQRQISYRTFQPHAENQPRVDEVRTTPPRLSALHRFGPPPSQRGPVRDEAIRAYEVRVVREDGSLTDPQPLTSVLSSIHRKEKFLVQVAGHGDTEIPICKIQDKIKVREAERAKDKAARNAGAKKDKQLELGWGIGPNDLGHRLNKMKDFLEQGKRVEIIVGKKRRAREVGPDESAALLVRIRNRIERVEGAKEWKVMEGIPGDLVTIFVERKVKK
ncbi:hypothetical protein MMC14_000331 [Varicellaria rhodocarpa]|nr:hypothetical protein [Varicellaria rhodocarpa]